MQKWEKLREVEGGKNKKVYDSKASKDRKIKYNVHEKIVNFMEPLGDEICFRGRSDILRTLFGCQTVQSHEEWKTDAEDENMGVSLI